MFIIIGIIISFICVGLIFLTYWIPKKFGYPKIGKFLGIFLGIFFSLLIIYIIFEDQFFFKRDARKLLSEQDIHLTDNFEIIENKSMSGIADYYRTFSLAISEHDKNLIIEQIKKSNNFKGIKDHKIHIMHSTNKYFGSKIIQNYESENQFVRECFEPSGKKNYAPTYRKIEINKQDNKLIFEDIEE
jgi:hypothetical protein